jgi:triphosphoribosyl-dephospho-CoA synthase
MNTAAAAVAYTPGPTHTTPASYAERIAALAERSLLLEIHTWPKPGLVSHVDAGSHTDMDAGMFRRSAAAIRPFFVELVRAGERDHSMSALRKIGLRAESAMLSVTAGVNTHRGAIFGLGLLCAAAGLRRQIGRHVSTSLGEMVQRRWGGQILEGPRLCSSNGEMVGRRYGAGGARVEAAEGFPALYGIGVPSLRRARNLTDDDEAARVHACMALIAVLEDTNLLHRGGTQGLLFAQAAAQGFLDQGGVAQAGWRASAQALHQDFIARRLSPGGAADMLAMSVFVTALEQEQS